MGLELEMARMVPTSPASGMFLWESLNTCAPWKVAFPSPPLPSLPNLPLLLWSLTPCCYTKDPSLKDGDATEQMDFGEEVPTP